MHARITHASGVDVGEFHAMTSYPGEVTVALSGAASLRLAGGSLPAFLQNLDAMHARVSLSFPELRSPSCRCTEVADASPTFHPCSERSGPTDLLLGLLEGLRQLFSIDLPIAPLTLKAAGADHDTFHVTYAPR